MKEVSRGDIWLTDVKGIAKAVLIISSDELGIKGSILSTKHNEKATIMLEDVMTIHTSSLMRKIATCPKDTFEKVHKA